jgi:RNA polymerase sigma factor (sigma-70 family)
MIGVSARLSTRSHHTPSETGEAVHDESAEPNTHPSSAAGSDATASDPSATNGTTGRHASGAVGAGPSGWDDASDADLITFTRAGDGAAYGELWRRHSRAARTVARSFTSSLDPDDLVQESFAKIYQALQKGGGPTGAFRPYLFTTVRNTASAWGRARREASIDTLESFEDPASRDEETMAALDRSLTATAFRSLPTRWQEVLWYCEVEQMTPQQVAPLLAMKPNAVAALAYRAREGLRQAWIQAHIAAVPEDSEHRWTIERIGSYTRGSLGKRDATKLENHLDSCARCTIVAAEAREVGSRIALVLLPLAAGTAGATGYLAWMQTGAHTAVATAAMPAAVLGGHGMGVGAGFDPSVLATLTTTGGVSGGAAGAAGSTAGSAGSSTTASAGAASAGVTTTAGATAGAATAGAATAALVSGAIALVAASAVAAALALGPSLVSPTPTNIVVAESGGAAETPTTVQPEPTGLPTDPAPTSAQPDPSPTATEPLPPSVPTPSDVPNSSPTSPPVPSTPTQPVDPERPVDPQQPIEPVEPEQPEEPGVPSQPLAYTFEQGGHQQLYPTVAGVAEPGATVTFLREGRVVAETPADEQGRWSSPILTDTPIGPSTLTIRQTTPSGVTEERTEPVYLAAPPTILSPTDGSTISALDVSIELDAIPGTQVYGRIDGLAAFLCDVADGSGELSCEWITDPIAFGLGEHTVQVSYGEQGGVEPEAPARSIRVTVVLVPVEPASEPASEALRRAPADETGVISTTSRPAAEEPAPSDAASPGEPERESPEIDSPETEAPDAPSPAIDTPETDAPVVDASTPEASAVGAEVDAGADDAGKVDAG